MEIEAIRQALADGMKIRVPEFDPTGGARAKIELIEDYMQKSAFARGEMEEALSWALSIGRELKGQWERVEGYEVALRGRAPHSKDQIDAAKRTQRADLWDALEEARALVSDLGRHIKRLEFDHQAESRVYSLITGS